MCKCHVSTTFHWLIFLLKVSLAECWKICQNLHFESLPKCFTGVIRFIYIIRMDFNQYLNKHSKNVQVMVTQHSPGCSPQVTHVSYRSFSALSCCWLYCFLLMYNAKAPLGYDSIRRKACLWDELHYLEGCSFSVWNCKATPSFRWIAHWWLRTYTTSCSCCVWIHGKQQTILFC